MAVCDAGSLLSEACDSGFVTCLSQDQFQAAALQLLKTIAADESTIGELFEQACDSGFACLSPEMGNAVALQLACNISEG